MSTWKQLSPTRPHRLAMGIAYGLTDIGLVRESNEDNFLIDESLGLVMLGDGMGGHDGGEIASAEALCAIRDFLCESMSALEHAEPAIDPDATCADETLPAIRTLYDAIEFVNQQLYRKNVAAGHAEGRGMGTTLTGLWQPGPGGPLLAFHVGDSRLYRWRGDELTLLTRDHTLHQMALDSGSPDPLPPRNLLLQAIGPVSAVRPDVHAHALQDGDLYLLCTDGLHGGVPEEDLIAILASADAGDLGKTADELVARANALDGRDNITAVLLKIDEG